MWKWLFVVLKLNFVTNGEIQINHSSFSQIYVSFNFGKTQLLLHIFFISFSGFMVLASLIKFVLLNLF